MSNIVFILGAGASKQGGAPLMSDFLDVAHNLWKTRHTGKFEEQFKSVFDGISKLQQVHSKSTLDIHNVESVFAAFEMAKTLNKFSNYDENEINILVDSIKSVIVQTIEKTLLFPIDQDRYVRPPQPYSQFAELLKYLTEKNNPKQEISIITFNYDLALDYTLFSSRLPFFYGLEENSEQNLGIPLLKLHGLTA